jgi:hypothetical protein
VCDRHTGERATAARGQRPIGFARRCERRRAGHGYECVQQRLALLDAREHLTHQLDAGEALAPQAIGELRQSAHVQSAHCFLTR